ncbi:hypothetical protein HPP92_028607 [Vanilla planifolia]|uniref:Peptidase S59 domain-containing protein n=1 Tax=Vanilla planifolia TaxID=51239 RepID=A0A835P7W8_VANPL|nr:hypothetical protein HPP92_028607 [Vanilla planifolia]
MIVDVFPRCDVYRSCGSAPAVQYGISSLPVSEKPTAPVRISSLVAPRHLSQRRIRLPARRYNPRSDGERIPFFSDDEAVTATPKADALFVPRENPRALIIRPIDQWPTRNGADKQPVLKINADSANENGKVSEMPTSPIPDESHADDLYVPKANGHVKERMTYKASKHLNGPNENHYESHSPVDEHGIDIESLMPKLHHSDYYTVPQIPELASKERAEPGFCRHVKDFVVGHRSYGSIKFFGETDVRSLDLESIVQFNNREVIVYRDEGKKPPVGQGLNKPAEVTLLNIKCMNKKTGQLYTEGPKVARYREMLVKKAEEQGAEFVSFDPVKGEWKFRVKHFSCYEFVGEEDLDHLGCYEP